MIAMFALFAACANATIALLSDRSRLLNLIYLLVGDRDAYIISL